MDQITRRQFLKKLGFSSLVIPTLAKQLFTQTVTPPDIVVAKGNPAKAIKRAFTELGGLEKFIKPKAKVLIKPNLSFSAPPEWGATTSPTVIKEICKQCLNAGAERVIVADHTIRSPGACLDKSGVKETLDTIDGVVLKTLNNRRDFRKVELNGKVLKSTEIAKIIDKVDVFINLAQAKCHSATGVSLSNKGLMGLIWNRGYLHAQMNLHKAIGDLGLVLKPDLVIIDATRVLLTKGPSGPGRIEKPQEIIVGTDSVAVDSLAVSRYAWYGKNFSGSDVRHLVAAYENGIGEIDIKKLKVIEVVA